MKITYIDLGCNRGETIAKAIKQLSSHRLVVHGIEANPEMAEVCRKRFAGCPFVKIHNFAVSESDVVSLYLTPPADTGRFGCSIFEDKVNVTSKSVEVPGKRFSDFVKEVGGVSGFAILKANIEGAEIHLVRDMEKNGMFGAFRLLLGSVSKPGIGWEEDMHKVPSLKEHVPEMRRIMEGRTVHPFNAHTGKDVNLASLVSGMLPRILATGFQRSGTTLMRRLIHAHPDVFHMLHESRLLMKEMEAVKLETVARIYMKRESGEEVGDLSEAVWGEKVPLIKTNTRIGPEYIRFWRKIWGDRAKIVYMVRHPYDVGNSSMFFNQNPVKILENEVKVIPVLVGEMRRGTGHIVKFEDLVLNPVSVLRRIFEYCGIDASDEVVHRVAESDREALKRFDKVEPGRAFAYLSEGFPKHNVDVSKLIELENTVEGPKYEL